MNQGVNPFTGLPRTSTDSPDYASVLSLDEERRIGSADGVRLPMVYSSLYRRGESQIPRSGQDRSGRPTGLWTCLVSLILLVVIFTLGLWVVGVLVLYGTWLRLKKLEILLRCMEEGELGGLFYEIG